MGKSNLIKGSSRQKKDYVSSITGVAESMMLPKSAKDEGQKPVNKSLSFSTAEPRNSRISVVLTESLHEELKRQKEASGARSMNDFVFTILQAYCNGDIHN